MTIKQYGTILFLTLITILSGTLFADTPLEKDSIIYSEKEIVSIDFEDLDFREYSLTDERKAPYLYELIENYRKEINKVAKNSIFWLDFDKNKMGTILDSVILYSLPHYSEKYQFGVNKINRYHIVTNTIKDLEDSRYFKNRLNKWDNLTTLEYLTFRAEWNLIKIYYKDFDFDKFVKLDGTKDVYKKILSSLFEKDAEKYTKDKIDNILMTVRKYDYSPLHFYYKPNSVKEQFIADELDINSVYFKPIIRYYFEFQETLMEAERKYKVNREIIIGILEKETKLGKIKLKYNLLEVLLAQATQYVNNPVQEYEDYLKQDKRINRLRKSAVRSIIHTIKFCIDNDIKDPSFIKSNFVGAIGHPQFMPFNLYLARDGDGDKIADLNNSRDAIMSIANFLNSNGWSKRYDLENEEHQRIIEKKLMAYNSSPTYTNAVFLIAQKLKQLVKY